MNFPRGSTHVETAVGMVEDATSEETEPILNYSTGLRVGFGSYETRHEELPARRTYTGRSRPDPAICDTCTAWLLKWILGTSIIPDAVLVVLVVVFTAVWILLSQRPRYPWG